MNTPRQAEFDRLVKDSRPYLMAVANRCGRKGEEAKDLVQETMVRGWGSFDQTRLKSPRFWLRGILKNLIIDQTRTAKAKYEHVELTDLPTPSALTQAIDDEDVDRILSAIERLSIAESGIIRWLAQGFEPFEIAQRLGIRGPAARARIMKARKRMAQLLE